MDLSLSDEQEALRDGLARFLAKTSSAERVREAEPLGFDERVWAGLAEMGVPAMGVPETAGGSGAALADLAVVAEQCGSHLAAAPVLECMVANRLLHRCGAVVDPVTITALGLRPAVDGHLTLVPGAAVARQVVGLDDGQLVAVVPGDRPVSSVSNLGSAPLADVDLRHDHRRATLASGADAATGHETAVDEWRALTACWLVGLARAALDIGVHYTKERKQFGVPIGSFQAVQHRLADLATALDGAALLAAKAVWCLDTGDVGAATLPAMAFAFCGETAQAVAAASLHYHGGYGFMEEYDIQLYFRRAKAARLVLGDPRRQLQDLAGHLFGPTEDGH